MTKIVDAWRCVITKGNASVPECTSYFWGAPKDNWYGTWVLGEAMRPPVPEDQWVHGYDQPCRIEILVEGARIQKSFGGDLRLYVPAGTRAVFEGKEYSLHPDGGLTAKEALAYGLARVI